MKSTSACSRLIACLVSASGLLAANAQSWSSGTASTAGASSGTSGTSSSESESFSHWSPNLSGGLSGQAGTKTKDGFFLIDGYFTPYEHMNGGGVTLGGEWIHPDVHIGIGGLARETFLTGHEGNFKIKNDILDLALHIPVQITDWLVIYGGAGIQLYSMEYSYTIPGTFRYQDGKGGYFSRNGKKIIFNSENPSDVTTLYAGLRILLTENFYLFGEYHKDSGTITLKSDDSDLYHYRKDTMEVEMDASRFVIGAGFSF